MSLNHLISFFTGFLKIIVRGNQLEKFINLTTGSGLYLWDIRRPGADVLQLKMRAHGLGRLRPIAKKSGCTIKISHKHGWPFIWRRLAQRKIFFIGALCFCLGLTYMSSFVWFIKLDGVAPRQKPGLLKVLQGAGLRCGIRRQELLTKKGLIEREALLRAPSAVWLGIGVKGVVAEVKVVPRKTAPAPVGPADMVAVADGLVTKIMVVRGVPLVKEGDVVMQGQLLISGTQWYNDLQSGASYKEEVTASGVVEAKVWHDLEIVEPKAVYRPVLSEKRYIKYQLRWGKQVWQLGAFGIKPQGDYFWQRHYKQLYRGRNPSEIVEITKDIYQKVTWKKVRRPLNEIRRSALAELERRRKILNYPAFDSRTLQWFNEGAFVKLQVTMEDRRDIAKVVPRVKGANKFFGSNRVQNGN
ncbi:MAG TPA: sporulation protein YqfD [Bacillota bacterium]